MSSAMTVRNQKWFPNFVPAHEVYLSLANEYAGPNAAILHLGAGRDALGVASRLPGRIFTAVDCDEKSLALNPAPHKVLADGASLPLPDESFDLVLCEHVFEHLEHPASVLAECFRVLKPKGQLLFLTPNKRSYIAFVASLTPYRFHIWYRSKLIETAALDTFPTFYRLNTCEDIIRLGATAGFELEAFRTFVGWPTYFEGGEWLHRMGVFLNFFIEKCPATFHISLVGVLTKPRQNCDNMLEAS